MSDLHAINEAINKRAGRQLVTSILIALVLLTIIFSTLAFAPFLFSLVVILAFAIATHELITAYTRSGVTLHHWAIVISNATIMLTAWFSGTQGIVIASTLALIANLILVLGRGPEGFAKRSAETAFTLLYLGVLPSFIVLLASDSDGFALVSMLVIIVAFNDTFAYLTGVLIGKHRMAPKLSPKKSWEGFAGGLIATAAVSAYAFDALLEKPWWLGLCAGLVGVFAATFGDLIESALKRDFGIKDMSSFLPGHGGMFDRIDSATLTAPALWIFLELTKTLS
jgi:phosphatidate cytidylyltransferase